MWTNDAPNKNVVMKSIYSPEHPTSNAMFSHNGSVLLIWACPVLVLSYKIGKCCIDVIKSFICIRLRFAFFFFSFGFFFVGAPGCVFFGVLLFTSAIILEMFCKNLPKNFLSSISRTTMELKDATPQNLKYESTTEDVPCWTHATSKNQKQKHVEHPSPILARSSVQPISTQPEHHVNRVWIGLTGPSGCFSPIRCASAHTAVPIREIDGRFSRRRRRSWVHSETCLFTFIENTFTGQEEECQRNQFKANDDFNWTRLQVSPWCVMDWN